MPTYEYECNDCGTRFERKQSMHDEPIRVCPQCSGAVRRILFPVGIVFKGSGFYVTDNRRVSAPTGDSKSTETTSTKAEAAKTEPANSSSTESAGTAAKAETPAETKSPS